ncbi:MAG: hypothetical protein AAF411_04925 [Myxococcota bacterium]
MKRVALAAFVLAFAGCSSDEGFAASCGGAAITNCLPFEASVITEATAEPNELTLDDLSENLRVQLRFDVCEQNPRPHEVAVAVRIGEGEEAQVVDILTLRDDGRNGDATASDGEIDVEVVNPFVNPLLPTRENVFLRFQVRSTRDCSSGTCVGGTCVSELFEIPYRTGTRL